MCLSLFVVALLWRVVPYREELELRLGPPYKLDGTFASFWAIERMLETVRRYPSWGRHMDWLADHVADYVASAYTAMGIGFVRTGTSFDCSNTRYRFSVGSDIARIVVAAERVPMFYGLDWLGAPILQNAFLPYYVFATLAQNQPWAEAEHDLIGRKRDHLDRVVPYLTEETLRGLQPGPGLDAGEAYQVAQACVWPPLGFQMNEQAEYNLQGLEGCWQRSVFPGALRQLVLQLAGSQNYFVRLVAAKFCLLHGITPRDQNEALAMREAASYFGVQAEGPLAAELARFLPDDESPLRGREHRDYVASCEAASAGDFSTANSGFNRLVQAEPGNAMFLCARGDALTHLGQDEAALADFNRAVALNPNYWQARINRAVLNARRGDFAESDNDLYEARRIRFADADTRNNLLCNYFFQQDDKNPVHAT